MKPDQRSWFSRLANAELVMIVVLLFAAFLRLWNFKPTLQFLGDQGRDAIVVSQIFRDKDIVLIGPVTSTGNMYLGPLYYYFMAPFLWLTYPGPLGPAYAVAVLSLLTVWLMYRLGREIVGERAAVFAAIFFAFSSTVIGFARFSWNPNPAPLFSLLFIWCLYRTQRKEFRYWIGVSACVAVLMQLHYVTLVTGLVAFIFWVKQALQWRTLIPMLKKQFVFSTITAVIVFLAFLSPLVVFDMRHQWLNVRSFQKFVTTSQEGVASLPVSKKITKTLLETHGRSLQLFFETTIGKQRTLNTVLLVLLIGLLIFLLKRKHESHRLGYQLLTAMYVMTVLALAFYRGSVFDHYISFFFPVTFLLFGGILSSLSRWKFGWIAVALIFTGYLWYNVPRIPLSNLGWTIDDMKRTSQSIYEHVKPGEKYNIVLLSETKDVYGQNYRYFLSTTDKPPLKMEHFGEVETLFIIDEQKIEKDVTNLPIYEIVVFPNHTPAEVYDIQGGPRITVLHKKS